MLHSFIAHIQQQHLFPTGQQVLLAVSGGVDSVVLAHLMHTAGYPFAVSHCNFHLRPDDCDCDERFVRQLAENYGVPIHVAQFNTLDYASREHLCIEEAARNLRYDYFRQIRSQHGYAAILTAHHRDDATETFFLNLFRGTGLSGLHGILPIHGDIVRPLLPFGRDDIERYAFQYHLQHVEDASNASLNYRRNQIRHQLMPVVRQIQPAADHTIQQTILHLQSAEALYNVLLDTVRQQLVSSHPDGATHVDLDERHFFTLASSSLLPNIRFQLYYELLKPYGFNAATVGNMLESSQSGRLFVSRSHTAQLHRGCLVILPIEKLSPIAGDEVELPDFSCRVSIFNPVAFDPKSLPSNTAVFDADTVLQPLRLRHWQQGDRFQPLGMNHGTQLVSDYFSDHKLSLFEKKSQLLLVDADDNILWIVGRRTDHPHRVTPLTRNLLTVVVG